ncbi:hypothetical protein EJ06DRAFT_527996 [Trichodelitschia bisporula]|uniref:Uncharacterized protein n=1 Tax=Trichodelitschia bisporula TaxID=703511 RepID=A0A6G1I4B1_9PEZI|nr:hypothetical protein EJ06DRAFT_527996 [Trichodelitschia bisporula]
MPVSFLLPQFLLPLSSVQLGRFVISTAEPHQDFHDSISVIGDGLAEKIQSQYEGFRGSTTDESFAAKLTSFLSASFSKRTKSSLRITSTQVRTYYLKNATEWFRGALQHTATRMWFERKMDEGEDIFMVVGYHTVLDARIIEQAGEQRAAGGSVVLPVSAALMAVGIAIPLGGLIDPGVAAARGRMENELGQFIAQGEQICAVQYRKVQPRWFSRSKIDKIMLSKDPWWERFDKLRDLQEGGEDVVEVVLSDSAVPEGEHDECQIGPDVFVS